MPFAFSAAGLTIETLDEIRTRLQAAYTDPVTGISAVLDVSDDSVAGRLIGIQAAEIRSIQEQVQAAYTAGTVDATGVQLAKVALLTGTVKRDETFSETPVSVTLGPGVTLPAFSQASLAGDPNAVFETIAAVTNPGAGNAAVDVTMRAIIGGPLLTPIGTLTQIVTPSAGWISVNNVLVQTVIGLPEETDPELRTRRVQELNSAANSHLDAIVTDVRAVEGVVSVKGYENTTSAINSDGLPPHSFEIVVWETSADNDEIAQAIWDSHPAGIASVHGTAGTVQTGDAEDSEGTTQPMTWTLAQSLNVYFNVHVIKDPDLYPIDGDDQVKAAIVTEASRRAAIGQPVNVNRLFGVLYYDSGTGTGIPGIVDVETLFVGLAPSPVSGTVLSGGSRQFPLFATTRVNVTNEDA
jgi:hypothetical protein